MLSKKGFWVLIILLLASSATAINFRYTIIQEVAEDIPKNSGDTLATTCHPQDPENVQLRLPFVAQKIRAQACNDVPGNTAYYRSAGLQICTGTNCAPLVYSGSHKGKGLLCSLWSESTGDTIKTCAGNERASAGRYHAYIYTEIQANLTEREKKLLGNAKDLVAPYAASKGDIFTIDYDFVYWNVYVWMDANNDVFACYDSDRNQLCDVEQAEACEDHGWDWNNKWYIPLSPQTPGSIYERHCTAFPDDKICTGESTNPIVMGSFCCGSPNYRATPCKYYPELNAICGKNAQGDWKWISAGNLGQARQLSCPTPISFLISPSIAHPRQFWTCGGITNAISTMLGSNTPYQNFPTQNIMGVTSDQNVFHDFLCVPNEAKIYECTEDGNVLNAGNLFNTTGEWINQSGIQFCNGNRWVTDLDLNENRKACIAARQKNTWPGTTTLPGIAWTGSKCCGDPADGRETYNDQWSIGYEGTSGGCYNSTFIPSGGFVDPGENIINHQGTFFACNVTKARAYLQGITPLYKPVCGQPLLNATLVGTKHHILCTPEEKWMFTNSTETTQPTGTTWSTSQGCCLSTQCWDGTNCKEIGKTITVGDRGYRCAPD